MRPRSGTAGMGRYKNPGAASEWGKRIPEDLKSNGGGLHALPPGGDRVINLRGRAGYKYEGPSFGCGGLQPSEGPGIR